MISLFHINKLFDSDTLIDHKQKKVNIWFSWMAELGYSDKFNKDIGQAAIRLSIDQAKGFMNFSSVVLDVRINNKRAIGCYKRCGFKIVRKRVKITKWFQIIPFYEMIYHIG